MDDIKPTTDKPNEEKLKDIETVIKLKIQKQDSNETLAAKVLNDKSYQEYFIKYEPNVSIKENPDDNQFNRFAFLYNYISNGGCLICKGKFGYVKYYDVDNLNRCTIFGCPKCCYEIREAYESLPEY